jgi:hypothetical protein
MDYFLEFHWWYLLIGFLVFTFIRKGKGGIVVQRYTAQFDVIDPRFQQCLPEANYAIFKEGSPDRIDIEIDKLPLASGETVEFHINGLMLVKVKVSRGKEAEFDHWGDEGVDFPIIKGGEVLDVKYLGETVLKGVFQ